jgi:hypothetical protein
VLPCHPLKSAISHEPRGAQGGNLMAGDAYLVVSYNIIAEYQSCQITTRH